MQHVKPNRADTVQSTQSAKGPPSMFWMWQAVPLCLCHSHSQSLSLSVLDVSWPYHVLWLICRSCKATSGGPKSKVMFQLRSLNFRESSVSQAATQYFAQHISKWVAIAHDIKKNTVTQFCCKVTGNVLSCHRHPSSSRYVPILPKMKAAKKSCGCHVLAAVAPGNSLEPTLDQNKLSNW